MTYLNYNNFDGVMKEKLLSRSKVETGYKYGMELKRYAVSNQLDCDLLIG